MTIVKRMYLGFGLLIGLLTIALGLNCVSSSKSKKSAEFTRDEASKFTLYAKEMKIAVLQVQQWLTDIAATQGKDGLDDGLDEAKANADKYINLLNDFRKMYQKEGFEEGIKKLAVLEKDFSEYYEMGKKMAQAYISGGPESGNKIMPEFDTFAEKMTKDIDDFVDEQKNELDTAMNSIVNLSRQAIFINSFGGVLMALFGILLTLIIGRSIVKSISVLTQSLKSGADQTSTAASQVSAASQQLSQGATQQAASLQETSSSLDEISSMTKQNADNAIKANQLAQEARGSSEEGNKAMKQMQSAMEEINASSDKISKIIKTIEEIAFQTNLLALNAAVEAARAGEHGKGFAVVAEEVRNLARRSAESAKDTAALIEDSINKVKSGTDITKNAVSSLESITKNAQKVADIVSEIAQASKEQSEGVNQVASAVAQLDQVTQQNAASAQESAVAAEELSSQSDSLRGMIRDLQSLVTGTTRAAELAENLRGGSHLGMEKRGKQLAHQNIDKTTERFTFNKNTAQSEALKKTDKKAANNIKEGVKMIKPEEIIPLDEDNI